MISSEPKPRWRSVVWVRCALFFVLLPILFGGYRFAAWNPPIGWRVAFSPDGRLIASSYSVPEKPHGFVEVRSLATGRRLMQIRRVSPVLPLAFTSDGRVLATGHSDGTVRLWRIGAHEPMATYRPGIGSINSLHYSRDGKVLVVVGSSGLALLDAATGRHVATLELRRYEVWRSSFAAGQEWLAVSAIQEQTGFISAGEVRVYDVSGDTFKQIASFPWVSPDEYHDVAWSPDATQLAVAHSGGMQIRSIQEGKLVRSFPMEEFYELAFSPKGTIIATTRYRLAPKVYPGTVDLRDIRTGARIAALTDRGPPPFDVTFSRDGAAVATTGHNGTTLWDVATARRVAVFSSHRSTLVFLWSLLAAFVFWCILWVWSGSRSCAKWRPAYDVGLLNCLVLGALMLRMSVTGNSYGVHRPMSPIVLGVLGSLLSLLVLWMMLGGRRWSLRVPGFLAGTSLIWAVPLILWAEDSEDNFEIAVGAVGLVGCLILILKTLQYFGLRIVHTDRGAEQVLGGESQGQLPLKDALLWTAATALLLTVARFLSPHVLSFGDLFYLIAMGVPLTVTATVGIVSALGRHLFLYIPLACAIAAGSGWMASVVWGTLGIRWSLYLQLSTVTTTICSLLVFRAHGYRLKRIAKC